MLGIEQSAAARTIEKGASITETRQEREAYLLIEAIEEDCARIARLFETCRSSRDFGLEELREFEKLVRHRWRLAARLERLRRVMPCAT
jgi:hypothetical protein